MAAAEELESLYEKRLAVEAERFKHLKGAKDDLQYKSEEAIERLKESHRQDIQVGTGDRKWRCWAIYGAQGGRERIYPT